MKRTKSPSYENGSVTPTTNGTEAKQRKTLTFADESTRKKGAVPSIIEVPPTPSEESEQLSSDEETTTHGQRLAAVHLY